MAIPEEPVNRPITNQEYGAKNKVLTAEAASKAREIIRKELSGNQLNSGIDPEILLAGIQLGGYHIEAGARTFEAYSNAMIQDVGDAVKPYLRSFYEGVRHFPGFDSAGMTESNTLDNGTYAIEEVNDDQSTKTPNDQEYKTWIKKMAKRFQEDETECWPAMSSTKQQNMITFWEYHRPKMYTELKSQGLLKETAYVLECKMMEEWDALRASGMNSSDAKLQAEQDWMIMNPEDWDEPEEQEYPESPTEY